MHFLFNYSYPTEKILPIYHLAHYKLRSRFWYASWEAASYAVSLIWMGLPTLPKPFILNINIKPQHF